MEFLKSRKFIILFFFKTATAQHIHEKIDSVKEKQDKCLQQRNTT